MLKGSFQKINFLPRLQPAGASLPVNVSHVSRLISDWFAFGFRGANIHIALIFRISKGARTVLNIRIDPKKTIGGHVDKADDGLHPLFYPHGSGLFPRSHRLWPEITGYLKPVDRTPEQHRESLFARLIITIPFVLSIAHGHRRAESRSQ